MSFGHPTHSSIRGMRRHRHNDAPGHDGERAHPHGHGHGRHRGDHAERPRGLRPQARRGALRAAILSLLAEQPMHGYQVMQELEARSGGRWRPSAGSVYPTLQQLEDEQLVSVDEIDGRRTFQLTDAGRSAAATTPSRPVTAPGPAAASAAATCTGSPANSASPPCRSTRVGSPATVEAAATILSDARRSLYRLLADDAPTPDADAPPDQAGGHRSPGLIRRSQRPQPR